jgi:hypothetical protein
MTSQHCQNGGRCADGECIRMWPHNAGMTCDEVAKRKAVEDAEYQAISVLSDKRAAIADEVGDEPPHCIAAVGQSAERAMLTRNKAQADGLTDTLAALEIKAARYQRIIDAPGVTEKRSFARFAEAARRLVDTDSTDDATMAAASQEAMRLEVEKRAAASAAEMLAQIVDEIEMQKLRIAHVEARTKKYVNDVINAELERLGSTYLKAAAALKSVSSVLFAGLQHTGRHDKRTVAAPRTVLGWRGTDHGSNRSLADLPRPRLDTCNKAIPAEVFEITIKSEHDRFFDDIASQLVTNPAAKVAFPI